MCGDRLSAGCKALRCASQMSEGLELKHHFPPSIEAIDAAFRSHGPSGHCTGRNGSDEMDLNSLKASLASSIVSNSQASGDGWLTWKATQAPVGKIYSDKEWKEV